MKVSGSYESVVRGVSEQVPQDRRSGQHAAETNLINDPVRGACRRHGSVLQDEIVLAPYAEAAHAALLENTAGMRAVTFYVGGKDYDLVARTGPGTGEFAYAFDRQARQFIPVVYAAADPTLEALKAGGVSASTNLGKYLVIAGNNITTQFTSTDRWDNPVNRLRSAVWIRGGAYARTFKVTVTMDNATVYTAQYKTKAASYPELLDTSGLDPAAPNYNATLNNMVNAYNSAATAWIGQAAEDITPQNIATKLAALLTTAGLPGVGVVSSTITISAAGVASISTDDGGDDSLINAVSHEVTAPELVSTTHYVGRVIKVRPKRSNEDDAFYLEAVAKDAGATGWAAVYWKETAGTVTQPTSVFVLATVKDNVMYMAGTANLLAALTGFDDVPDYKASSVGDPLTAAVPYFLGKRIDYLGVFQDRLEVGSDAVIMYSRPGDYFNWFRQSVLTIADNDPVEQFALGSEDDRITGSATFDRSRIYFGNRFWYSVAGNAPLTPKSNGIVVLREEPEANAAPPKSSDNFVFYCKRGGERDAGERKTKLHQIQAGLLGDSPEGTDISSQLDGYLDGDPVEVVPVTSPNTVFLRTDGNRRRIYTYAYLDAEQGGQRLFDAWSAWEWEARTGDLVAISRDADELLVYLLRHNGVSSWLAAERFTLESALSKRPYMDSLRPYSAPGSYIVAGALFDADASVAFDASSMRRLVGAPYGSREAVVTEFGSAGLWVGLNYTSTFTPTNPYMKDRSERSIVSGRLTLSSVQVTVADTGGFICTVDTAVKQYVSKEFNGRILGNLQNTIGQQPLVATTVQCVVGREIRECSYTLTSVDWLPLTVTSLGWVGQYFNNTRRV